MRGMKWGAVLMVVAIAACAEKTDDAAHETTETPATETPAPADVASTPPAVLPAGVTADMVTQGQQIFASTGNCYTCHGADAKGTQLAPNLTDAEWINIGGTYDEVVQVVTTGVATPKSHPAPMPAMGGAALSEDQVKQVAAYVWSLGGGK